MWWEGTIGHTTWHKDVWWENTKGYTDCLTQQIHGLNPEQDTNLEELRNAATDIIGIDQLGRGQVMSPVAGWVPQNSTDIMINLLR